ncbi:MAG TPA: amidohydrolase family protein, partial [Sphingomicrobium sp.]|nr:amidohydrolase family protein [Sphingomicrobium sp.]
GWPDLAWLERELAHERVRFLGEMLFVYSGVPPNDARMRPYWKLAAKYDVPVSVHINRGPPPGVGPRRDPRCCPAFDSELGNPALLRPILRRHPGLRILIQHVGAGAAPDHLPFTDETMALLRDYRSVYVDLSILNDARAGNRHEAELKRLIDAGFGDRIMFGSDTRPIGPILRRMEKIHWLSQQQRRAILYDNAARFLRLDRKTIEKHHRR